jgi:hypothetical protein
MELAASGRVSTIALARANAVKGGKNRDERAMTTSAVPAESRTGRNECQRNARFFANRSQADKQETRAKSAKLKIVLL